MQANQAMGDPVEAAYIAVERAYGEGHFDAALNKALALQPKLQASDRDDLALRLQLLIGHIHFYGLQQPGQAAAAYGLVLEQSRDAAYQALASQGLELCQPQESISTSDECHEPAEPAELPATPWLSQLSDPEQALQQIRAAWSTAIPSQQRSSAARQATGPINPDEATPVAFRDDPPTPAAEPAEDGTAPAEEPAAADTEERAPAAEMVLDEPGFGAEEWAEYARGLLLVELSSQPGAMR